MNPEEIGNFNQQEPQYFNTNAIHNNQNTSGPQYFDFSTMQAAQTMVQPTQAINPNNLDTVFAQGAGLIQASGIPNPDPNANSFLTSNMLNSGSTISSTSASMPENTFASNNTPLNIFSASNPTNFTQESIMNDTNTFTNNANNYLSSSSSSSSS